MERTQFTQHLKEKAAAYALTAVVALGSLALVGEGDGSTITPTPSHSKETYPHPPTETSTMSREEQCANMEKEAGGPVKGC